MSFFVEKREGKRKTSYRVAVRIEQDGRILHREARTFPNYRDGNSWGAARDKELKKALADPDTFTELVHKVSTVTLGEVIEQYQKEYSASYGRTIGKDLALMGRSLMAQIPVAKLRSSDIVSHIRGRVDGIKNSDKDREQTGKEWKVAPVAPSTASNDLVRLQTVLDAAWASWDIPVPREELEKARIECRKRRMVAKSVQRERTATDVEIDRLVAHFKQATRGEIRMSEIVLFAVASCRRLEEITQLRWVDNDPEKLTGIVPRLKDPSGNRLNVPFRYTLDAWNIASRQPRTDERIFPYNHRSISSAFTRACKVLGIQDLRFHDLRHTAVTRLFRQGYQIHEVTAFSLHRSWATLKRYYNESVDQVPLR